MLLKLVLQLHFICWLLVTAESSNIGGDRQNITLSDDGGYTDLLVVIDEEVKENLTLLTNLKVICIYC